MRPTTWTDCPHCGAVGDEAADEGMPPPLLCTTNGVPTDYESVCHTCQAPTTYPLDPESPGGSQ